MTPGFHEEEALGKVYDSVLIRRLWPYLREHWRLVGVAMLLIPVRSLLEALPGPLIGSGLDALVGAGPSEELGWLGALGEPPGDISPIPWISLILLSAVVIGALVEFARMLSSMRNDELAQAVRVAQRPNTWEPYMYQALSAELRGRGMLDESLVVLKACLRRLRQ